MGFLESYTAFASQITDSPLEFHSYIGLATAGVCIGRNRYFQFGHQKIYPNFYLIILAPSSFYRKSTALSISKQALYRENPTKVFPSDFSVEKLMEILKESPVGCFYWFEFKSLMSLFQRDYMVSAKSFITELFDSPEFINIARKGVSFTVENPCVSIISATTTSWFLDSLKEGDIFGGFLARFLFVHSKKKLRDDSIPPEPDQSLRSIMQFELSKLSNLPQEQVKLNADAYKIYDLWYHNFSHNYKNNDASFRTLFARLTIYCLKIAIVIQTCTNAGTLITPESITMAIQFCEWLMASTSELCHKDLSFSHSEAQEKKLLSILRDKGGKMERVTLLRYSHLSAREFEGTLETLMAKEHILKTFENKDGSQKKSQFFSLALDK